MTAGPSCVLSLTEEGGIREVEVEAVVFDCDGLLMDSESIWLETVEQWCHDHGLRDVSVQDYLGLSVEDAVRQLADAQQRLSEVHELATSLGRAYSERLTETVPVMPGARELVRDVAARVPVAVASNGRRDDVSRLLAQGGILPLVRVVCTIEDVERGKPAPDLYLSAVTRLGVPADRTVAFEDSPSGAAAAAAAGLPVVGVNPQPGLVLPTEHRLASLDDVTVIVTGDVLETAPRTDPTRDEDR